MLPIITTWFSETPPLPSDPEYMEWRRLRQLSAPVGDYGLIAALPDFESKKFNQVTLVERSSIGKAALSCYIYCADLGHDVTLMDLVQLKIQLGPIRLFSVFADAEIALEPPSPPPSS